MIISVTAPRKGMGQTITAINLSLFLSKMIGEASIIIDMNRYCRDIEYYLSNTDITKGLDDYYSLSESGLLTAENFKTCVKKVCDNIDIMASNECFELGSSEIENLLTQIGSIYKIGIIDTASSNTNAITRTVAGKSHIMLAVVNQSRNIVQQMLKAPEIYNVKHMILVVNRYRKDVGYDIRDIKYDMQNAGFDAEVFPLNYDIDIINECNDHSILNYVLNNESGQKEYMAQLKALAEYILEAAGIRSAVRKENEYRNIGILKVLPILNAYFQKS